MLHGHRIRSSCSSKYYNSSQAGSRESRGFILCILFRKPPADFLVHLIGLMWVTLGHIAVLSSHATGKEAGITVSGLNYSWFMYWARAHCYLEQSQDSVSRKGALMWGSQLTMPCLKFTTVHWGGAYYYSHFTNDETKTPTCLVTCPRSHDCQ